MTTTLQPVHAKRGRKAKPYVSPITGKTHDGLYKCPDGRWRLPDGSKYTCHDERQAIRIFNAWMLKQTGTMVSLPLNAASENVMLASKGNMIEFGDESETLEAPAAKFVDVGQIPESTLVEVFRRWLYERPLWLAQQTACPQLAHWAQMGVPKPSAKLVDFRDAFAARIDIKRKSMKNGVAAMDLLTRETKAETVGDLTREALIQFNAFLQKKLASGEWSGDYVRTIIRKIKDVFAYGIEQGFDRAEIDALVNDRMNVVKSPRGSKGKPNPVKPEDFRTMLTKAQGMPLETALLLLGLNAAMYIEDVAELEWQDVNFEKGYILNDRQKTGFLRVAVLWPETLDALRAIMPSNAEPNAPVLKSKNGIRFSADGLRDRYDLVRANKVEFNQFRDGAETAATEAGIAMQFVRVLAGHTLGGESDRYIRRNPMLCKPATDSVHAAYFP